MTRTKGMTKEQVRAVLDDAERDGDFRHHLTPRERDALIGAGALCGEVAERVPGMIGDLILGPAISALVVKILLSGPDEVLTEGGQMQNRNAAAWNARS